MEIDPKILDYMNRMSRSMTNDFFDGEEALKSESFYRIITGKPPFTKEEIETRVTKWVDKEKEIWEGYAGNTELRMSEQSQIPESK